MYCTPVVLNPRKLERELRKSKWNLPNDKMDNHSKEKYKYNSKSGSSTDSKLKMATASFATFSSGVYSFHANPSQTFNLTVDAATRTDAELRIEASFWVSIIFMVFLCSVITVYCILIQREDQISCEQNWPETNVNSENNQTITIVDDESKSSAFTLKGVSKDVEAFSNDKLKGEINPGISTDSHETTSLEISDTSFQSKPMNKGMPKCCFIGAVIYTENEKKKHFVGDSSNSRKSLQKLAWQLETKPKTQWTAITSDPVCD